MPQRLKKSLLALSSLSLIVAAPAAFSQNSASDVDQENAFRKVSEACIATTTKKLAKLGLAPNDDDSDYEVKFDDTYAECMSAKGMPVQNDGEEIPLTGDEALPSSAVVE